MELFGNITSRKIKFMTRILLFTLIAGLVSSVAVAQKQQKNAKHSKSESDSAYIGILDDVMVIGNIGVSKVKPQAIKYQTKDLVSQRGGTAGDILKAMPSVAMGGSPNHNRDIRFRGMGKGYTQVLIDGQPTGAQGNERESILDMIPASQIESIEISSNPTADMLATGVNGVVNIILKKGYSMLKKKDFIGNAYVSGDHLGGYNGGISSSAKYKNFSFGVNLDRLYRIVGNYGYGQSEKYDDKGALKEMNMQKKDEDKKFTNNSAKLFLNYSHKGWDFYLDYLFGEQQENKSKNEVSVGYDKERKFQQNKSKYNLSPEDKKVAFQNPTIRIVKHWDKGELNFSYSYNYSLEEKSQRQEEYLSTENLAPVYSNVAKRKNQIQDFKTKTHLPAFYYLQRINKSAQVKLGYQGFLTNRDAFQKTEDYSSKTNEWQVKDEGNNNFEAMESVNAVFATLEWQYVEKFKLNIGYRHEFADIASKALGQQNFSIGRYSTSLPSAHIQYFISANTYLASSIGRRIRRPSFNDLNPFVEIKNATEKKQGNPNLRPELSWAYEFGVFSQINKVNFGANYFHRNIREVIHKKITEDNGVFLETPMNLLGAIARGIELIVATKPFRWFDINANYSRFWSKVKSNDEFDGDQMKDQFAWTAKTIMDFSLPYKINLQVISNWVGPKNSLQEGDGKMYFTDLGISKKIDKSSYIFARVTDVFDELRKHKYKNTLTQKEDKFENTQGRIFSLGVHLSF